MFTALIFLYTFQILGVHASSENGLLPRAPQAGDGAGGPGACSTVDHYLSFCSSAIPGFSTADGGLLANCFCYSSTSWIPNVFDGAVLTCAQYAATGLPSSAYSDIASLEGFCSSLGVDGAGNGPATVSATTTPTNVTPAPASGTSDIFKNAACTDLGSAFNYCNSVTPDFTAMDVTSQARCLCYSSTSWVPDVFDGAVSTCAEYASSAAPASLTDLTGLEGFCSDVGNFLADGSAMTATGGNGGLATIPENQATTSMPGVAATIATPVATTIQQGPTSTQQSLGYPGTRNGIWGFGILITTMSMIIIA